MVDTYVCASAMSCCVVWHLSCSDVKLLVAFVVGESHRGPFLVGCLGMQHWLDIACHMSLDLLLVLWAAWGSSTLGGWCTAGIWSRTKVFWWVV